MSEEFVVRHYSADDRPTIKGNGFDGLQVGEDRQEAQEFVDYVNKLAARLAEAERERDDWRAKAEKLAAVNFIMNGPDERAVAIHSAGAVQEDAK